MRTHAENLEKCVYKQKLMNIILNVFAEPGMAKVALYLLDQVIFEKMGSTMGFLYQDLH